MPLPIVHLGVAKNLLDKIKVDNISSYYLGSIAPDAVHMRENSKREDKNTSHLHNTDIEIWKINAKNLILTKSTKENSDFYCGYGIHILTDIYWNETIYAMFISRYDEDKTPAQDKTWAYYNDTDKLDFELYKKYEHRPEIWDYLQNIKAIEIDSLVSADEVSAWKNRTLHWFDSGESQHKNPIKYIFYDDLLSFMKETTMKIYKYLYCPELKNI